MKTFNIIFRSKRKDWDWTAWEVLQYNIPANLVEDRLAFWRKTNEVNVKQSNDIYKTREYKAEPVEEA